MVQVARWRIILVVLALIWGAIFAVPNVLPQQVRDQLPGFVPKQVINLGLDLRGGSYLLMQVDMPALRKEKLENELQSVTRELQQAKPRILYEGARVDGEHVRLRVLDPNDVQRALKAIGNVTAPQTGVTGATTQLYEVSSQPDGTIAVRLTAEGLNAMSRDAVMRSIEVIRKRIDELGTSEISISPQGANRIVIQAPGDNDPEALKRRIGQTAKMTFHMVDMSVTGADLAAGRMPPLTHLAPQDDPAEPFVAIRTRVEISGEDLVDAQPGFDQQTNEPVVSFRFNQRAALTFCRISQMNVGKRFAIVLDGKVLTAPSIREQICGGSGQISGNFTPESSSELSALLRAGALPAPLTVEQQSTVGPDLGQDAIDAGVTSMLIAFVLVLGFMVLAYGFLFGGISIIALLANGVLLVAAMSATQATLTLPGIAGLILTLAVALDANVLIYERMREEARAGRSPALAIDAGFSRAIVTIIDANFTHLGAATIMFMLGAGPVKGFAWTLAVGVFTSVFTAVFITQVLIAWWYSATRPKKLPIA
jgi:protein-export membrane protein SecD